MKRIIIFFFHLRIVSQDFSIYDQIKSTHSLPNRHINSADFFFFVLKKSWILWCTLNKTVNSWRMNRFWRNNFVSFHRVPIKRRRFLSRLKQIMMENKPGWRCLNHPLIVTFLLICFCHASRTQSGKCMFYWLGTDLKTGQSLKNITN